MHNVASAPAGMMVEPLQVTKTFRLAFWMSGLVSSIFVVAMIAASWVGFLETDDLAYAKGADGWLLHIPFLGQTHWELRHFIVLPLAASFATFGHGEVALAIPMLLYSLGLLLLTGLCVGRIAGPIAGMIAPLLIAGIPTFAQGATLGATDIPEAFFVMASFWAFYFATVSGRRLTFIVSGILAGCGFLTRETTVALLIPYAVLFLIGYGKRGNYVWMGAGFIAIVGMDFLYLYLLSGDLLWRMHVTQHGVSDDNPYNPALKAPAGMADPFGLYALPRFAQAVLLLFASPTIGFLAWFGVPATAYLVWSPPSGEAGKVTQLFALLAAAWLLTLSFVLLMLWIIPRYQIVTLCALAVPSSMLLSDWLSRGLRWRVAAVLFLMLGTSFLLSAASYHGLMFGERALVSFARGTNEQVRTDPATLQGAQWLLQAVGVGSRVTAAPPIAGGLYFVNHTPRRHLPAGWIGQEPPPESAIVASYIQPSGLISTAAAYVGLDRILPKAVWLKIQPIPRRAEVVRVP